MDPVTYLTTFTTEFGPLEWLFFVAQLALVVAGVYLVFLRAEPHPVRRALSRSLGYALLVVGALGTLFGALRLAPVEFFTMPIWFTLATVLEVGLAGYALYELFMALPGRVAAYDEANRKSSRRGGAARPQPALQANGAGSATPTYSEPRPVATTTRRDARRDRKRRSR